MTGEQIAHPRFFRRSERALAKAQRRRAQADTGTLASRTRRKVVAHLHERLANRRTDFAHKLSRRLVDELGMIVFEDVNIARMIKNHSVAKSVADAAWNQFASYTRSKAASAGRTDLHIDPRGTSNAVAAVAVWSRKRCLCACISVPIAAWRLIVTSTPR